MRKKKLLEQIVKLQGLLTTQAAEQRTAIEQLHQRVEQQERRSQELELRMQQRLAALERAYAEDLAQLVAARERQHGAMTHLRGTVEAHVQELHALEAELDAA